MDGARGYAGRLQQTAALIGLTSGLFSLYFVISTDDFGGAAYGPRWYTVFIPRLFLFVAVEWTAMRTQARGYLFLALAAISFVNGYQGALNPWRAATPLLRLEYAAPERPAPVDMALSGVVYEELEPDLLTTLGTRRVDKRWFDARSCLIIPAGPMWLAVDAGTPLDPALAERSGLPSGGDLTSHVDLRPARDAYLEQLATSAWTSPVLVPVDAGSLTPVSLPVEFGGRFVLLRYELLTDPPTAGNEVVIITAWQIKARLEPPLAIFVHMLDSQGRVSGQFDGLAVNPESLRPGDVLLHVHRFAAATDTLPGRYWLQLGLYNPETMIRLTLPGYETDRLLLTWTDVTE